MGGPSLTEGGFRVEAHFEMPVPRPHMGACGPILNFRNCPPKHDEDIFILCHPHDMFLMSSCFFHHDVFILCDPNFHHDVFILCDPNFHHDVFICNSFMTCDDDVCDHDPVYSLRGHPLRVSRVAGDLHGAMR
jgi:hypothetical protein